ncbi:MAG: polysaccharide pyruvyl transferase family protein [Thermodesulfobacteriota bacterium]
MKKINKRKKKLLILSDRFSIRNRLTNLGNQVMWEGLHRLIENNLEYQILPGRRKSFPYFTIRRFKKKSSREDIERIFNEWFDQVTSFSYRMVKFETWVSNFLDNSFLFNNHIFRKIDKKVQDKFSMGLIEALKPYILRNYYSHRLITQIKNADIVLSNGHDLASDHLKFYLPMEMFEVFLAKKLGKKVIVATQTVSVTDPIAFNIVSFVYKMVDMHITREPLSKKVLLTMGVRDDKIVVSADSAFAIDISDRKDVKSLIEKEGIEKGSVAVIIRSDRNVDYESWVKVINHIQEKFGRKVFCLFTSSRDEHVFKKLAKICRLHKLSEFYDYPILIQIMGNFDFVITDRYHGAIFAILANTPVIPVYPNTFKTKGLFTLFDYPIEVLNTLSESSHDSMIESIERVVTNQREIKDKLSKARTYLINRVNKDIKVISNV